MGNIGCNCAEKTLAHLGRPSCVFNIKTTRRLGFMHLRKADGTRNFIDISGGTFDNAFWQGLLTHPDPKQRLYLTPDLENVTHPNTEATMEEFASGAMQETRPEFLGFEGFMVGADSSPTQFKELRKTKCQDVGVVYIDVTGSTFGDASEWEQGKVYPIPLMKGSFRTDAILPVNDASGKIQMRFIHDFYKFDYGNFGGIQSNLMDVTLMDVPLVLPVTGNLGLPTTTGFSIALSTAFIQGLGFAPITGLVAADFVLTDSVGAPVVITSVTEGNDGTYAIVATLPAGNYSIGINIDSHIMTPVPFTTV